MMVLNEEDFRSAIRNYMRAKHMRGPTALAAHLGKPLGTVESWLYKTPSEEGRAKIIGQHPEIFATPAEGTEVPPSGDFDPDKMAREMTRGLLVGIRTEIARESIANAARHLRWFLFEATAEERDEFRDALGKEWTDFLELARAMTSETAFQVATQEGSIDADR